MSPSLFLAGMAQQIKVQRPLAENLNLTQILLKKETTSFFRMGLLTWGERYSYCYDYFSNKPFRNAPCSMNFEI